MAAANACNVTSVGTLIYTTELNQTGICTSPSDAEFVGLLTGSGRTGNLGRNTERTPRTT